jgi:hypothetical protein
MSLLSIPAPPGIENPALVTRPGETAPPPLGPSPSDGSAEVTPPYSIGTPVIPPIGPGPEPIVKVTPPLGWQPEAETAREIAALMFDPGGGGGRARPPGNLEQDVERIRREQRRHTGGDISDPERAAAAAKAVQDYVAQKWGQDIAFGDNSPLQVLVNISQNVDPVDRYAFFLQLGYLIATEQMSNQDLDDLGSLVRHLRSSEGTDHAWQAAVVMVDVAAAGMRPLDVVETTLRIAGFPDPIGYESIEHYAYEHLRVREFTGVPWHLVASEVSLGLAGGIVAMTFNPSLAGSTGTIALSARMRELAGLSLKLSDVRRLPNERWHVTWAQTGGKAARWAVRGAGGVVIIAEGSRDFYESWHDPRNADHRWAAGWRSVGRTAFRGCLKIILSARLVPRFLQAA